MEGMLSLLLGAVGDKYGEHAGLYLRQTFKLEEKRKIYIRDRSFLGNLGPLV